MHYVYFEGTFHFVVYRPGSVTDYGPCTLNADSITSSCILIVFIVFGVKHAVPYTQADRWSATPRCFAARLTFWAKSKSKRNQLSVHLSICLLSICSTTVVQERERGWPVLR